MGNRDDRPPHPAEYRGVPMTTRVAALYAAYVEHCGITDWTYGPCEFFTGDGVPWVPDFRLGTGSALGYVAVRPVRMAPVPPSPPASAVRHVDQMLMRMEAAWAKGPAALTLTFMADGPVTAGRVMVPVSQVDTNGPGYPWLWRVTGETMTGYWPGLGQWAAVSRHAERRAVSGTATRPLPQLPGRNDLEGER